MLSVRAQPPQHTCPLEDFRKEFSKKIPFSGHLPQKKLEIKGGQTVKQVPYSNQPTARDALHRYWL